MSSSSFRSPDAYLKYMGRWSRRLAAPFIEFAGVDNGDFVLDAGTGTGSLAEVIHEMRPHCRLIGIDIAEPYLEFARRRCSFPNYQFQTGCITEIPFGANEFDKALTLLVINFVNNPLKAVLEMKRVTKTGGLVAAAIWDFSGGMGMLELFLRSVQATDPKGFSSLTISNAQLGYPGALLSLWQEAGLKEVQETGLQISKDFKNFDDFWLPFLAGATPLSSYVSGLSEEKKTVLKNHIRGELFSNGPDGPFSLPARAWAVRGKKM